MLCTTLDIAIRGVQSEWQTRWDYRIHGPIGGPRYIPAGEKAAATFIQVFQNLIEDGNQDVAEKLLTRWAAQTLEKGESEPGIYHEQTIPLFCGLGELVRREGTPLEPSQPMQAAVSHMLVSYLNQYIGRQPSKPTNWSKEPMRCTCDVCRSVNPFLQSPTQTVHRISTNEKNRKHLEYSRWEDLKCTTERTQRPFVLVMKKIRKREERDQADWYARITQVLQKLESVGVKELRRLVLPEYHYLLVGDAIQQSLARDSKKPLGRREKESGYTATSASTRTPLQEMTPRSQGRAPISSIPAKRPAEMAELVDLTDD
ncbi:hypothetical protein BDZ85DRAFT_89566 [Elsinoe ampelina]|uniref:Uncharacterized protein n=1 Tax=Elsinoe ampelina TaxID=302913 RepID=A0A6A6GHI5_9PEZI|nr:hypothetical protein BDZ85DRAFT_89566 [Elsinoe ampelina]